MRTKREEIRQRARQKKWKRKKKQQHQKQMGGISDRTCGPFNGLAGNVGNMSVTCRRQGEMSPIFVPTGEIWRHGFLCVGTLLCRDFPTLTYHEQMIFG